jgi:hypothetical protein
MNAEDYTPIDKTDKLLARLCREGYLVRTREMDGGEEVIEFMVGPRGKVEVGSSGVAGLVREVYGRGRDSGANGEDDSTQMEREMRADFEARLRRSLGIVGVQEEEGGEEEEERREEPRMASGRGAGDAARTPAPNQEPRRSSRRATTAHESEEDESSGASGTDSVKDESEEESD